MKKTPFLLSFALLAACHLNAQQSLAIRPHILAPLSVHTNLSNAQEGLKASNNSRPLYATEIALSAPFKKSPHWGWLAAAGFGSRAQVPTFELPVSNWNTLGHPGVLQLRSAGSTLRLWTVKAGAQWSRPLNKMLVFQGRLGPAFSLLSAAPANHYDMLLPYFNGNPAGASRVERGGRIEGRLDHSFVASVWGEAGMALQVLDRWQLQFGISATGAVSPNKSVVSAQLFDPANETPWGLAVSTERFYYLGGYLGVSYQFAAP